MNICLRQVCGDLLGNTARMRTYGSTLPDKQVGDPCLPGKFCYAYRNIITLHGVDLRPVLRRKRKIRLHTGVILCTFPADDIHCIQISFCILI